MKTETAITVRMPEPGKGCGSCNWEGLIVFSYPRPGGWPGNQQVPCPKCSKRL